MAFAIVRNVAVVAVWGLCLHGALSIARWQGDFEHTICGPWGCGPRLPPVISCHVAWLVALALPAGFVAWSGHVTPAARRVIGSAVMGVAGMIIAGFFAWHVGVWWPQATVSQQPYFWHRFAFMMVTAIDVPAVQMLVLGLAIRIAGREARHATPHEDEPLHG